MRRIPALLGAAALLAATLAGCTGLPGSGCAPAYSGGDASSIVKADGDIFTAPTLDFPTPIVASKPQVSTLIEGKGAPIPVGSAVGFYSTVEYAKDGKSFGATTYDKAGMQLQPSGQKNSISKALECAKVGDRIVLVTQFKDTGSMFGSDAAQAVDPKEVLVDVIDVVLAYPGKSDGFNQLPKDGMPTVVTAVDGTPGIQVPSTKPPKKTEFSTIKAGSGSVVKKGKTVVLQFTLWTWPDKVGAAPKDSTLTTWTDKIPRALKMTSIADGGGLPKGLTDALIGQKIGSQVLVVIPPGTDGFPASALANDALPGVTETSTLIWVVDLLGIQK